ncbi:AAA family ATPase [Helicobacter anatolicus]|uniref:AAA family ATPase n=1 Tax=Helicobacter anatolicus TaxID=2905874 RepID=UPI001E4DDB5C|nr:AAA family ATPase [Helicobacter anatolicus]MCE3038649.1 AAA family ATPase [Helicobacter anatolicus]
MIKKIEINNFRGIESLAIQDFGEFNIFVGENSCGKTSILEAISICCGSEEVGSLIKIQNFRHTVVLPSNLTSLFYNFNFLSPIEIAAVVDSQEVQTQIYPMTNDKIFYPQDEIKHTPPSMLEQKTNGLSLVRKYNQEEYTTSFSVQPNGDVQYAERSGSTPPLLAVFLSSDIEQWGLKYFIDIVRKEKKREELVEYLKLFDDRVRDIEAQENSILVNLEGVSKLININFLGEGFKKYTTILALMLVALQWHTRFCVCIDEIENGLHFSSIQKLLTSILKLSKQIDFQFFFTTHSIEFLDISRKILGEKSRVYKVVSTQKGVKTYPYSQDGEAYFTLDRIDPRGKR